MHKRWIIEWIKILNLNIKVCEENEVKKAVSQYYPTINLKFKKIIIEECLVCDLQRKKTNPAILRCLNQMKALVKL